MYMNEQELLRLEEVSVTNENDSVPCGCVASPAAWCRGAGRWQTVPSLLFLAVPGPLCLSISLMLGPDLAMGPGGSDIF